VDGPGCSTGRIDAIERANDPEGAAVNQMGIDHGGPDILVTQQRLDGADVGSCFEQVRGEAVPQGVAARPLLEPRCLRRVLDRPLERAQVEVMPHWVARVRIPAVTRRRSWSTNFADFGFSSGASFLIAMAILPWINIPGGIAHDSTVLRATLQLSRRLSRPTAAFSRHPAAISH